MRQVNPMISGRLAAWLAMQHNIFIIYVKIATLNPWRYYYFISILLFLKFQGKNLNLERNSNLAPPYF